PALSSTKSPLEAVLKIELVKPVTGTFQATRPQSRPLFRAFQQYRFLKIDSKGLKTRGCFIIF
ncbi:MAG: hypothetical protein ABGX12_03620, partial [Desulfurobacteriaceae bacterium]